VTADEIWGLVLAGGVSSRLGVDKTQLRLGGQTLVERAVALVSRLCPHVAVSCRQAAPQWGCLPLLLDVTQRVGPLGGILTALEAWQRPILVLACDMPWMEIQALRCLVEARARRSAGALMTVWARSGTPYIEALAAVYEPEAAPLLRAGLEAGVYQLSRLIPAPRRHHLPYGEAEAWWFFNVNTPEDWEKLQSAEAPQGAAAPLVAS
jgi:molybdopterin-guanine dinucleotide biosynthesis protein A